MPMLFLSRRALGALLAASVVVTPVAHVAAQPREWSEAVPSSPSTPHCMVYDPIRGAAYIVANNYTWRRGPGDPTWTNLTVSGPSATRRSAMVFDSARGVTVFFGGADYGPLQTTWEFNGDSWTFRPGDGPSSGREGRVHDHAMAYDAARGVTVLFGGLKGGARRHNETWEWNGKAWTQRDVTAGAPSPRSGHAMSYDPVREVSVLFGGVTRSSRQGVEYSDETWEWDGDAWTQRLVAGPPPLAYATMFYDAARGVTVLFGGRGEAHSNDIWEWDGIGDWMLRTPAESAPAPRSYHSVAYDPTRGVGVIYGGFGDYAAYADTWEWNGATGEWTLLDDRVAPRSTKMVYDARRGVTVLFGGTVDDTRVRDVWEWEGPGHNWMRRTHGDPGPDGISGGALVYDSSRGVTVFCRFGEIWEWDGDAWTQRSVTGKPSFQLSPSAAYDSARGVIVLFGGRSLESDNHYTWEFDGKRWTSRSAPGPSARRGHKMVYDSARGVTVLYGGYRHYDTWEWDGSVWSLRSSVGPIQSNTGAMVYDAARAATIFYTNGNDETGAQTWAWDGVEWTLLNVTSPPPRHYSSMAYDSKRDLAILFGGELHGDTWVLGDPSPACPADFNLDGSVTSQDLFDFLIAFFNADADFNHDGVTDSDDFFDFLASFFISC